MAVAVGSAEAVVHKPRWSSMGVDGGRVPGKFPQKRASTGGATPSRLAAAMERWSVGEVLKF